MILAFAEYVVRLSEAKALLDYYLLCIVVVLVMFFKALNSIITCETDDYYSIYRCGLMKVP